MVHKLLENNFHWDSDFVLDENILTTLRLGDREYLDNFVESYRELFAEQLNNITY